MAKVWEPEPIEVYQAWIETISDEASDNLTNWENQFIVSLMERLHSGRNLTQAQAETLERIYSEMTK